MLSAIDLEFLFIAFVLGLRHASDPDHLVAVTSLVASDEGETRSAAKLGAWWGFGHAAMLVALGIPLIVFKSEPPAGLEAGAEKAVGVVILLLALRVIWKWARGDYRVGRHSHRVVTHSHMRKGEPHGHDQVRSPLQAFGIGLLHGLAGTGAVVVLLLAALPSRLEAGVALAVFAPASILSMTAWTTAFAWVLTRRVVEPVYRGVLIPAMGLFGVLFGVWYIGLV
jgi:ABC-type nickel/cobalt efflux system permease component RcnA